MSSRSIVFAFVSVVAAVPTLAAGPERHSGTLIAIDPAKHTVTLEEMGPWRGHGSTTFRRSITLTPATKVWLIKRSKKPATGGWPGGYVDSPLNLAEVHPGDFANVHVTRHGQALIADSSS